MSAEPSPLTSAATALKPMAGTATPASYETSPNRSLPVGHETVLQQDLLADGGEEEVGVAVVVVVQEKRGGADGEEAQPHLVGGVSELPVAGVQEEVVAPRRGHEEVEPAVAVDVARRGATPDEAPVLRRAVGGQGGADPGGVRDLGEDVRLRHHRAHLGGGEAGELPDPVGGLAHRHLGPPLEPLPIAAPVAPEDEERHPGRPLRPGRRGGLGGVLDRPRGIGELGPLYLEAGVLDLGEVLEEVCSTLPAPRPASAHGRSLRTGRTSPGGRST